MFTTAKLAAIAELTHWQSVPTMVRDRYKRASAAAARAPADADGHVFWCPGRDELYTGNQPPSDPDDWVRIKRGAAPLAFLNKPYELAGKLTGGPSPMSNALVSGLLTGGLGYGTGWLLEHLFPERFVERGRLRRTLGLLGTAAGALPGAWQYQQNAATAREAGEPLGWVGAAVTPTNSLPASGPAMARLRARAYPMGPEGAGYDPEAARYVGRDKLSAMRNWLGPLPDAPARISGYAASLVKTASRQVHAGGVGLRAVPMDAFNRAIWNDVRLGMTAARNPFGTKSRWGDNEEAMHTPPGLGAATSGLVTGIQEMYGGQSVLSPKHFIRGLATAGVDLATANLVGGTLGALGGLTPNAQEKLQNVGLWGGLIRGTVGSMLGL